MHLDLNGRGRFTLRVPVLLALLATPVLADHARDFRIALDGLRANTLKPADKVFLKDASSPGADRLLCLYELGAFYQLGGDPGKSRGFFNTADSVAHDYEGQAVVSAGGVGRNASAVLVNDSVLKYEGFGYDKVMSRTLNAVNFLMLGDMEGARVEVRKAEEYQRLERELHQRELQKGTPRGAESARLDNPAVTAQYGRMFDYVRNVRNSFENAFTYYLASQIYLARGEDGLNDAMVEIKKAYELSPQAPGVRSAYLEIARAQGGSALEQARIRLQVADADPGPESPAMGSVVVLFQTGLVPQLEAVKISLFAEDKLYNLAFPIYRDFGNAQSPLLIQTPTRTVTTSTVLDTRALAVKALQERMPGILTRGLLGAIAKGQIQKDAEKNYGPFAGLAAMVASAVLTQADRRSWLSLPAEVQVAKCNLAAGPNLLTLRGPGWSDTVTVNVTPGSQSFLLVRSFPGFKRVDLKTFDADGGEGTAPVQPAAPVPNL